MAQILDQDNNGVQKVKPRNLQISIPSSPRNNENDTQLNEEN